MTRRTMDTQPLPHDRECPQASLVLRERVQESHHSAGGYLHSYLGIGALLQEINAECKSLLAYHLLRLLYSLYGHLRVSSPRFLKIGPYMMYYTRNALIPSVTSPPLKGMVSHNQDHYGVQLPK
jgi:hypothetical protein